MTSASNENVSLAWLNALKEIRQRDGLTVGRIRSRLQKGDGNWATIGSLPFIAQVASRKSISAEEAIRAYAKVAVRRLEPGDFEVADAVLALYEQPGGTYKNSVITRREPFLAGQSEAAFVEGRELEVLRRFAEALAAPSLADVEALDLAGQDFIALLGGPTPEPTGRANVVVVGAAVMDIIFRIEKMPGLDESVQARQYDRWPGGKGLTQAIACSRLGLTTSLISVVGDDDWGREILEYLAKNGVNTDLVVVRPGQTTPVTGVLTLDSGHSTAIGYKNESNLGVNQALFGPQSDVVDKQRVQATAKAVQHADFLLTSFELPIEVTKEMLLRAKKGGAVTIVSPAPPYDGAIFDPVWFGNVDILVANQWELTRLGSSAKDVDSSKSLREFVSFVAPGRLRHLLLTKDGTCRALLRFSDGSASIKQHIQKSFRLDLRESAGERDAFCGMLAARLAGADLTDEPTILSAIEWATAAMACAGSDFGVPESMPSMQKAENQIETMKSMQLWDDPETSREGD